MATKKSTAQKKTESKAKKKTTAKTPAKESPKPAPVPDNILFRHFGPDDEAPVPKASAPEPKAERFVCNKYPSYKIGLGNRMIAFRNGEYITTDPEEIKAIMADPWFNLWIIPDNLALRQKRR